MTLSALELALYFIIWGFFYLLLVRVIAKRSAQAWIDRFDKDINPEGADLLLHLLKPVLDEIFTDNEQLLKDFKKSFFSTVATQVREAKAVAKQLNPVPELIKNVAEDNPVLGLILNHLDLPDIAGVAKKAAETSTNTAETSATITDWGLK